MMTTMGRLQSTLPLLLFCLLTATPCRAEPQTDQNNRAVTRTQDVGLAALLALLQRQSSTIDRLEEDLVQVEEDLEQVEEDLEQVEDELAANRNDEAANKKRVKQVQADLTAYKNDETAYKRKVQDEMNQMDNQLQKFQHNMDAAPKSVYFTAHMASHLVRMGQTSPVKFDAIVTNIGDAYNPHTGVFTAPVAGVYVFYAQLMQHGRVKYIQWGIYKSEAALCVNSLNEPNNYDKGSCLATVRLQKGDTVFVRHMNNGAPGHLLEGVGWCSFSGYLASVEGGLRD